MKHLAYVALGANLPFLSSGKGPLHTLQRVVAELSSPEITLVECSNWFESPPWPPGLSGTAGQISQPPYINGVAKIETSLDAVALLAHFHRIETSYGRDRKKEKRYDARVLDLDLLSYDSIILNMDGVTIPHPRLHMRRFVLEPLSEIAPDWRHPVTGEGVRLLLANLPDTEPAIKQL